MRYQFIAPHREEFAVSRACQALHVSESGYYAWKRRNASCRQREDRSLSQQIQGIFQEGRGVYGSLRVHAILHQQGLRCSRKRV